VVRLIGDYIYRNETTVTLEMRTALTQQRFTLTLTLSLRKKEQQLCVFGFYQAPSGKSRCMNCGDAESDSPSPSGRGEG
jgi:hypothetical protein